MMSKKMKVSSSPGRTDKFPTPLMMRFLRTNVGSRSRGRSRSSPMFMIRTKKNAAVITDVNQPEPSSPKVTCIGQVRARRSAKKAQSKRRSTKNQPARPKCCSSCSCSSSSCCHSCSCSGCCVFRPKLRCPRSSCFSGFFRKWVLFCRFDYCKKIDARDDSIVSIKRSATVNGVAGERAAADYRLKEEELLESSPGPPKNALLLTRCRSAPYRSSSLAGRFWGSDELETEEANSKAATLNEEDDEDDYYKESGKQKPNSPCSVNDNVEEDDEDKDEDDKEQESRKCCSEEEEEEEVGPEKCGNDNVVVPKAAVAAGSSVHPLVLTRCKSEPARTGERLSQQEASFCKQRRSDTSQACLQKGSITANIITNNCD